MLRAHLGHSPPLASRGCDDYCHRSVVECSDAVGMVPGKVASSTAADDDDDGCYSRCDAQQMRLRTVVGAVVAVGDVVEAQVALGVAKSCDVYFPVDPDLVELNCSTSSDYWERFRPWIAYYALT